MKILHIVASCNPAGGGVIEGVLRLGDAYRALGHSQHVLTLDGPQDAWVADCPSPVFAMGRTGDAKRFYPGQAIGWLRQHAGGYDGVVVDGLWNAATLAARRVLPGAKVPYAVFPHGMLDPWFRQFQPGKEWVKRQLFRVNEGPLLQRAHAVLFTAESERRLAAGAWPGWQAMRDAGMREQVVGFGTTRPPPCTAAMQAAFRRAVPGLEGRPFLLFLGRVHPKKGCELLLRAYAAAYGEQEWHLVMAGPGAADYRAGLQDLARQLGAANLVHWPGMLAGEAKWGALYGCEAMVLTSFQENFGVVVAEACACGRPVLLTDQVAAHRPVMAARAGVICRAEPASAAAALGQMMRMTQAERKAMGERGRTVFDREFTMERVARRVTAIFGEKPVSDNSLSYM